MSAPVTVYVSIGNSDDKLTQKQWSEFVLEVRCAVFGAATEVHGDWYSLPDAQFQNACWCIVMDPDRHAALRASLTEIRRGYDQDGIAWSVAETEFV